MLVTFPALFYFEPKNDEYSEGYYVSFPDFKNTAGTQVMISMMLCSWLPTGWE